MKATTIISAVLFTLLGLQAAQAQIKTPDVSVKPEQKAFLGAVIFINKTNLKQLAATYQCSDITVEISENAAVDSGTILGKTTVFKAAQTGKVIGDIKDGKCAYFVPYNSSIQSKKYVLQFSAPAKQNSPGCKTQRKLDILSPTVDYPISSKFSIKYSIARSVILSASTSVSGLI